MSHNPLDWSDGIPDCIIFASTADAERGAAMYRSMADALDAKDARIKELEGALDAAMEENSTLLRRCDGLVLQAAAHKKFERIVYLFVEADDDYHAKEISAAQYNERIHEYLERAREALK